MHNPEPTQFELTESVRAFIVHWGEMGSRWGINRAVAQIHALLYVAPAPLDAETIADTLSLARSTVSSSLKELKAWGLVRVVHVLGDRRDHYDAFDDVWEMFRVVVDERMKREVEPTVELLRESVEIARAEAGEIYDEHSYEKLSEMLEFFDLISTLYDRTMRLPTPMLRRLAKAADRVEDLMELVRRPGPANQEEGSTV